MSNLYTIQVKYLQLMRDIEEQEGILEEEQNKELEITQEQFAEKVDQYIKIIKTCQADIVFANSELVRISKFITTKENTITKLDKLLLEAIKLFGEKEIKEDKKTGKISTIWRYISGTFKLSTRKSPSRTEIDEETIGSEWKQITIKDKLTMEELTKISDLLGKTFETNTSFSKTDIKTKLDAGEIIPGASIEEEDYTLSIK